MITIQSNHLRAALLFAAKGDIRSYLNGICVHLKPDAVFLVATDGHRLLAIRIRKETTPQVRPEKHYIIPRTVIETALKAAGKVESFEFEIVSDTEGKISTNGGSFGFRFEDARYPDWERIIPSDTPNGIAGQLNANYIADVGKASKLFGDNLSTLYHIWHNGPDFACRVTWNKEPEALGIIMPYRPGAVECEWAPTRAPNADTDGAAFRAETERMKEST